MYPRRATSAAISGFTRPQHKSPRTIAGNGPPPGGTVSTRWNTTRFASACSCSIVTS
jgi:hypothetical protein